jgi:hypothetical protein
MVDVVSLEAIFIFLAPTEIDLIFVGAGFVLEKLYGIVFLFIA